MDEKSPICHGDHVATCVCCAELELGYEGAYSDVTPGAGMQCWCHKGHFDDSQLQMTHALITRARTCMDFNPVTLGGE